MSEETILTASKRYPVSPITVCVIITIIIIASAAIIYSQTTELKPSQYSSNSFIDVENKIAAIEKQILENKKLTRLLKKELAALREQNETLLSLINNMEANAPSNPASICMGENDSIISTSESFEIKTITSNIGANVRVKPGLDQEIIGNASKGTSVCIKKEDDTLEKDSYLWVKIYFPYEGWVAEPLLGD